MNFALTNPFMWPYVRRGAERLLHDLAVYLTSLGHRVCVYAMAPREAREDRGGVTYISIRQRWRPSLRQFNSCHDYAYRLPRYLARSGCDAVFCLSYFDAYAALQAKRSHGAQFKVLHQSVGIPTRRYFRAVPLDAWFMRTVLRHADELLVLSDFARETLRRDFGREALVIPAPIVASAFSSADAPSSSPANVRVLFVGDVDEPRKGARLLCRAFARIKREFPDAVLVFAGRASDATRAELLAEPALRDLSSSVQFLGVGEVEDLPALYRSASVTVLPAVWEAFGLVLVESLAAGTPVVGARHGGIPEIVRGPPVGELFDPAPFGIQSDNVAGLAAALIGVISRGKTAEVSAACHARARTYSWASLGPRYERTLVDAVHSSRRETRA